MKQIDLTRKRSHRLIAKGLMKKETSCSKCGSTPKPMLRAYFRGKWRLQSLVEMHHPDPTDHTMVIWLCRRCHHELHGRKLRVADIDSDRPNT